MASQLLNELEGKPSNQFLLRENVPGPAWAPFGAEVADLHRAIDYPSVVMVEEENCPRAMLVALFVEAAIAVGLYSGWQVLHMIR